MKRETLIEIADVMKTFFGVGLIFTYIFATDHRSTIIIINLVLWVLSIAVYRLLKK